MLQLYNVRDRGDLSTAHTGGEIMFNDNTIITVDKILFDTGALTNNFISRDLFESFESRVPDIDVKKINMIIGFADKTSSMKCDKLVRLKLRFKEEGNDTITFYEGIFVVADMGNNDIIIGLPAILVKLWNYFLYVLKGRTFELNEMELNEMEQIFEREMEENYIYETVEKLLQPWSKEKLAEAPEELEVPEPSQFGFASSFLGKTREEAITEFEDMFEEHISPEFRAAQPVEELLRTKGVKVFIPEKWEGIKGIDPLEIKFSENLPPRLKPKARPINPRLYEDAEKEFRRLCGYIYVPSRSPWASCLVIAPKATKPFIRACGDYVEINKYIPSPHYTVPNVRHELDKIIGYKVFLDIDLTNAFHQIRLHPNTSEKLSIQTPWGQFEPRFLPEGVSPGISTLQEAVRNIFGDLEWALCIFDNILLLAHDFEDGYKKFDKFLDRCIMHDVVLKFSKSWLGFKEVKFFGYNVRYNSFDLTEDRKEALLKIPFPENGNRCKKIRMLLGMGVFFSPFVRNYSDCTKHITDMTSAKFNWDESTWKIDYRKEVEDFKLALQNSCSLFYPNYELEWTLRTDASDFGVAGILFQTVPPEAETPAQHQTIALCSQKLSAQAQRWCTIEKEGYGIFFSVKKFSYYLRGKHFLIETDHNNLIWMEASEVAKIVRWRIYLQDFDFLIRHIPGKLNVVADCLSRLLCLSGLVEDDEDEEDCDFATLHNIFDKDYEEIWPSKKELEEVVPPTAEESVEYQKAIEMVHNSQVGHWGARETWKRLCKEFPGHKVPYQVIADFVAECANCQKNRRELKQRLIPVVRHLKPPHSRSALGIDAVTVTPKGSNGMQYIIVLTNLFSKLVFLFPTDALTAINLATAVWHCWANYGHTDLIVSDMGPDLKSQLFAELVTLTGMRHVFSIANRHVNGCERMIKEVNRHLRAILYDKRLPNVFDDATVIPTVQYILNTHVSDETGMTPFELTFGSQDVIYKDLLSDKGKDGGNPQHLLLRRLNENLQAVREISKEYQSSLVKVRSDKGISADTQNMFQKGDFVMYDAGPKPFPKMASRMKGPFEVVRQYKNDVLIRNLITGGMREYSVSDLEPFYGSRTKAVDAAMRDQDQYRVDSILSYTGDSRRRSKMVFKVKYADGDVLDIPWSPDLQCEAYYDFCDARPYLKHLTFDARMAKAFITEMNKKPITAVAVNDTVFVDLRFYGDLWYEALGLPDFATSSYVMEFTYTHWYHRTSRSTISARFNLNGVTYAMDNYLVFAWGSVKEFDPSTMILVDEQLAAVYPKIVEPER